MHKWICIQSILEGYNKLSPNAAKKIIDNGISESKCRRELEKKLLASQIFDRKLGQWLGFIIALIVIIDGVYLIADNHQISGFILLGISVIGLFGVFNKNMIMMKETLLPD
ncbi:MAG: DUF2335 domain-containing protein [Moheibacter sp.]